MNTFISALEERFNYKFTENGAVALTTTGSKVYDMFAFGAAYRNRSDSDRILLFKQAYEEDPTLALKCLFYIRDCRGGQGERCFFRVCMRWLARTYPTAAADLIEQIPEYGRYDDLFELFNTPVENAVLHFITDQLVLDMNSIIDNDIQGISLLAKWMPSENAHSKIAKERAKKIRQYIGMTSKEYRQMLSKLRAHINVLERLMSANRWEEIKFDKIPSKAGFIYRNAFARRDIIAKKYEDFIRNNKTKVNANTLYPYEIVRKALYTNFFNEVEREAVNKYWTNLPDYLNGSDMSMMCVVDTSGSMRWTNPNNTVQPIDVAISLGMYCAERMTGPFANKYISFSSRPQLINIEGIDFCDKVERIYNTNLCENTNLPAVFDLLMNIATVKKVKKSDIPKTIVVISDMEIDSATGHKLTHGNIVTTMDKIRAKWNSVGLTLPKLVYWNVDARNNTILDEGPGVSFVSGCSPTIFKQVLTGKTGVELMLEVLLSDRYKNIK